MATSPQPRLGKKPCLHVENFDYGRARNAGSGKGTLCSKITRLFPSIVPISSGDLFRKHIQQQTPLGTQVESIIARGDLVPDEVTVNLVLGEMKQLENKNCMLDGFPRTLNQAKLLDSHLQNTHHPLDLVMNIDVPHDIILQRVKDRWVHLPSGRTYNLSYNPPKTPGLDDLTLEKLSKRPDDDVNVAKKRLENYLMTAEPLLEYYEKRGILVNFRGNTSDELFPQMKQILQERCHPK